MPKTVTQRLNALEQKLSSDMEKGVLRYMRLHTLERRVNIGLKREIKGRERLRALEQTVRTIKRGAQILHDEDSRFNDRVLSIVRDAKVKRHGECRKAIGCVVGFMGVCVLIICAVYGAGSIAQRIFEAVTS